jgi:zinc transport system substrate-binding protein
MNKKYIIGLVLVVLAILVYSLNYKKDETISPASNKLQVTASFYPLYFFASEIGGDKAEVANVTPAGAEPHDFEPTAQDMAHMQESKLLILNGGGLEPWGEDVIENNSLQTSIVVAGEGLLTLKGEEHEHEGEEEHEEEGEHEEEILDPHIWLSPALAEKMVDKITEGYKKADAENKDYYIANANTLKTKLKELDGLYKIGLNTCLQKNIITSHSAFGYLAMAYGLKQVPITGLSPDAEPSPKELADITKFANENKIKYIFFESLVSPKLSQTLASEIGAQTLVLNPIEGLTPDEIKEGKDYFTEMKNNLKNLETALECS